MNQPIDRHAQVQDYYGKVLAHSDDLATNACCTTTPMPRHMRAILGQIHDEVMSKYYGCGLTVPDELDGCRVLDLGSGSGRDVYLVSKLVGENGSVVGVDMTAEQLAVANAHLDYHRQQWGHAQSNVQFLHGDIEKLDALDLADADFDVIISNCVINLATDKRAVLAQAHRLLRDGGEMYFSDIYCDRRIPQELVDDPMLYGECLSGALYWNDFQNLAKSTGFADPRVVSSEPLLITNEEVAERLRGYRFWSVTYRLFKLPDLEPACEDYGHAATYLGSITHGEAAFDLDAHHHFPAGKVVPVCGNTYRMLAESRYARHFALQGSFERHFGIFAGCGTDVPYRSEADTMPGACC